MKALRLTQPVGGAGVHPEAHERVDLLHEAGVKDYSIHLDEETDTLFGVLWRRTDHTMADLPSTAIMQRWWAHMADIMATNSRNEPVSTDLVPMFWMK